MVAVALVGCNGTSLAEADRVELAALVEAAEEAAARGDVETATQVLTQLRDEVRRLEVVAELDPERAERLRIWAGQAITLLALVDTVEEAPEDDGDPGPDLPDAAGEADTDATSTGSAGGTASATDPDTEPDGNTDGLAPDGAEPGRSDAADAADAAGAAGADEDADNDADDASSSGPGVRSSDEPSGNGRASQPGDSSPRSGGPPAGGPARGGAPPRGRS